MGTLQVAGDPKLDVNQLAFQSEPERRWLSYPGGRLCLNPASAKQFEIAPTPDDLALDLGGYVGTEVLRLPGVLRVGLVQAGSPSASCGFARRQQTIWYPHKLALEANYADGASLTGEDFFVDRQSTLIRMLDLRNAGTRAIRLFGDVSTNAEVKWDNQNHVLLVAGQNYYYALKPVRLTGRRLTAVDVRIDPEVRGRHWEFSLPAQSGELRCAIGFGFATHAEGAEQAIKRAGKAFDRPVSDSLAAVRDKFNDFLQRVPTPEKFSLDAAPSLGVTPQQLRQSYYMAWTFLYQSLMDELPENPEYPYPQMSLGKGALWAEGEHTSPATCGWESFLGIQWLSLLEPKICWQAYEGIMSRVDEHGQLGGESLPSRKAQTAWILYQRLPEKKRLAAVYPAIKRYLLWRESNPRWIYGNNKAPDEKDLEFVVSWLLDVGCAEKIADTLGLKNDAAMWRSKIAPMITNMREWFFSDPAELHQFYFANRKVYVTPERNQVRPIMILTALWVPGLPADMVARLEKLFEQNHQPSADCDGFNYLKYPDNQLVGEGLIKLQMPQAKAYVEAILRDCVRAGEFAETLENRDGKGFKAAGVKPSLFNAMNVIDFTWLLNGACFESGRIEPCAFPATKTD